MGTEAIIACRGVWKLFGPDPVGFLRNNGGDPTMEVIKAEGYIPAVCDASL